MRKYYQAALTLVAAVSLISLLFYRHEYNKLRYVLEVFSYFGKPNQKQISTDCTNNNVSFTERDTNLDESASSWQRLNNNLYVYSAYNLGNNEIHVIGFGKKSAVLNLQCIIFFERETKSFVGNYKYIVINSTSYSSNEEAQYYGYYLICTYTVNKVPVGISFLTESDKNSINFPILSVTTQPQHLNNSDIAVCIIPPLVKPMQEIDMITFLSFHKLIGINNFIAYDYGIPNNFNRRLQELSRSNFLQSKLVYSTVTWNFPFSHVDVNVIKDIIEADCLHRTYNKIMYISVLSWQEYIVLNYHNSITSLLSDYSSSNWLADRYKLNTLKFCTNEASNTHSINSTLIMYRETRFDKDITDSYSIFVSKPYDILSRSNIYTRRMVKDLILVYRYRICNNVKETQEVTMSNSTIQRFSESIKTSEFFVRLTSISGH